MAPPMTGPATKPTAGHAEMTPAAPPCSCAPTAREAPAVIAGMHRPSPVPISAMPVASSPNPSKPATQRLPSAMLARPLRTKMCGGSCQRCISVICTAKLNRADTISAAPVYCAVRIPSSASLSWS